MYHHLTVDETNFVRHLHFDESYQSALDLKDPEHMEFTYTSYTHLGIVANPKIRNVLFIGLGGGLIPSKFLKDYPEIESIDAVEIDPDVINTAKRYFQLPDIIKLKTIPMDGRLFVDKALKEIQVNDKAPYDMVVIDAYTSTSIPFHLTTREFLETVNKITTPDGVVLSNIVGSYTGERSLLIKAMTKTFDSVFSQVYLFPINGWNSKESRYASNVILIATKSNQKWSPEIWQEKAGQLFQKGIIKEKVMDYAQMLVNEQFLDKDIWYKDVPLLTDDYAPVDTYRKPL
jgi:spermidine synthase